ncbi:MAG TPA: hypothetical protein VLM87_03345 [Rubrivivax sp.]|nr:hypothetical protein [Rubrivivax sp.]
MARLAVRKDSNNGAFAVLFAAVSRVAPDAGVAGRRYARAFGVRAENGE